MMSNEPQEEAEELLTFSSEGEIPLDLDDDSIVEYRSRCYSRLPAPLRRFLGTAKRFGRFLIGLPSESEVFDSMAADEEDQTDEDTLSDKMTEEADASWLSRMFFYWFASMISLAAARRSLNLKHVPRLMPKHDPETHALELQRQWRLELERCGKKSTFGYRPRVTDDSPSFNDNYGEDIGYDMNDDADKELSLVRVMYVTYRWEYFWAAIPRLIKVLGSFVGPWVIKMIVSLIEQPTIDAKSTVWGLFLLLILAANLIVTSIALQHYWHIAIGTSIHMKAGLTALMYEKLLRLSAKSKSSNFAGKLTNLISADITRLQETVSYLHFLWASPMMMIICFISVTMLMGAVPTLAGFGVFFGLAPLSGYVAWSLEQIRAKCVVLTDSRVKATNEIFNTMKTVKVYALEDHLSGTANQLRTDELKVIRQFQVWKAAHNTLNFSLVPLMTAATFAVFVLRNKDNFAASSAFSVIALYYVLKWPFSMLAQVISNIVESRVSLRRIKSFLVLPELPGSPGVHGLPKGEIQINDADFCWDTENVENGQPHLDLKNISLTCKSGTLTCIIGPVGSGKSSVLNVILGEIEAIPKFVAEGKKSKFDAAGNHIPDVAANGTVCYAPQIPFLVHATVRENILFGKPWDEDRYNETILHCCLASDLDMLIAGDLTVIGERGINLSGGQKARIAMARAIYSDSDIYLLDDPLSAVDAHVGHMLFNNAIKGLLEHGKTVVLVTHQLQFVTHGDQLVIMNDGSITHCGTPAALREQGVHVESLLEKFNESLDTDASPEAPTSPKQLRSSGKSQIGEDGPSSSQGAPDGSKLRDSQSLAKSGESPPPAQSINARSSSLVAPSPPLPEPGTLQPLKNETDSSDQVASANGSNGVAHKPQPLDDVSVDSINKMSKHEAAQSKANVEQKEQRAVGHISAEVYKFYFGQKVSWWVIAVLLILLHRGIDIFLKVLIANWSSNAKSQSSTSGPSSPSTNTTTPDSTIPTPLSTVGSDSSSNDALLFGTINAIGFYASNVLAMLSEGADLVALPLTSMGMVSDPQLSSTSTDNLLNTLLATPQTNSSSPGTGSPSAGSSISASTVKFLWMFIIGNLILAAVQMLKETMILLVTCATGRVVYMSMFMRLLRAPMSFFDTTPKGRIAARCSSDTDAMDNQLGGIITTVCDNLAQLLSSLVSIALSVHWFVFGMIPMVTGYIHFYNRFINAYRELTRLTGTTKAPLFSQFSETLNGVYTLRAYGAQERFVKTLYHNLDSAQRVYFTGVTASRWLGLRMDILGSILICGVATVSLFNRSVDPGLMGMALSYCLLNTELLNGLIRGISDVEARMNSVERIEQYTKIDTERPPIIEDNRPAFSWPTRGDIEFSNVEMRYRDGLPLVLNGLSFRIKGGEKIGIVGRTGAGKSSLLTALLQLSEIESGRIKIDGVDIAKIGVTDLRSRLSIIPQDPTIFDGNIRHNIDPFGTHTDDQIWEALRRVHLFDVVTQLPGGIDSELADEGVNFSLGQRQLMCVARAILRKSKILLLDEASSSIDLETDYLLQKTLRTEFADCTTITIAHRIATIMDSDRVMVLEAGKLAEFDSPGALLTNPNSMFYSLHQQAQTSASSH